MRLDKRAALVLLGPLTLSACGQQDTDPGPGGVTVAEARALDEAAEMLDERRLPVEQLEDGDVEAEAAPQVTPAP